MIRALSLFKIEQKKFQLVIDDLRKIPQISKITLLTGDFDGILEIKINDMEELFNLFVAKIDNIDGIKETNTHVIMKEFETD
jgi:DNA-binding Lrp family transcriptional regulator